MDHKEDKILKCESCLKDFSNSGLHVHILQHGKKKQSECFKFYLSKYKHIDLFPFSKISKKREFYCECCDRWFSQLYRHLRQYSEKCLKYYQEKYGINTNNWPKGSTKIICCKECGVPLPDHRALYCSDCRQNKFNIMKDPKISLKNKNSNYYWISSAEWKEKISKIQKERYKNDPFLKKKQKQYMLDGGASYAMSFNQSPSKPQVILFNLVKELYPTTILNHRLTEINRVLDIAIPELKLDIEYDDSYWHQNKEADIIREEQIRKLGWNIIRFVDHIPTKEILIIKIKEQYA